VGSSTGQIEQHLRVTRLRRAPADEILRSSCSAVVNSGRSGIQSRYLAIATSRVPSRAILNGFAHLLRLNPIAPVRRSSTSRPREMLFGGSASSLEPRPHPFKRGGRTSCSPPIDFPVRTCNRGKRLPLEPIGGVARGARIPYEPRMACIAGHARTLPAMAMHHRQAPRA
jgi:hypothetical protein